MKGQASSKTASAGDLVKTLLVLVGIVIGGCGLSLRLGQVWFGLVWFGCGPPLHSG